MLWALVGAKRLECGSSLPLSFYAQTTCLSPYPIPRPDSENRHTVTLDGIIAITGLGYPWHSCHPWSIDSILSSLSFLAADGADHTDAQTTCLEPYRHDAANSVSVPISASEGFLRRVRQPPIGTGDNLQATPQSGDKTRTTCLSPSSAAPAETRRATNCTSSVATGCQVRAGLPRMPP